MKKVTHTTLTQHERERKRIEIKILPSIKSKHETNSKRQKRQLNEK